MVEYVLEQITCLTAEAVQRATLAFQRVDNVHGRHCLALGVLGVGNGIADDILEEDLENAAGLFVDETRDALHTATTSEPANRRLGDALDVVAQHLTVPLCAAFSESLSSFASARHGDAFLVVQDNAEKIFGFFETDQKSDHKMLKESPY